MKTRKRIGENLVRKLTKVAGGASYSITLPINIVRQFRWKGKQNLQLKIHEKKKRIVIEDWEK
tara:strand:- start:40137 stop:40325 length:189 start_codon:yes stop_codon:yes gene_type:complete